MSACPLAEYRRPEKQVLASPFIYTQLKEFP
jgi:hypothetical protein